MSNSPCLMLVASSAAGNGGLPLVDDHLKNQTHCHIRHRNTHHCSLTLEAYSFVTTIVVLGGFNKHLHYHLVC